MHSVSELLLLLLFQYFIFTCDSCMQRVSTVYCSDRTPLSFIHRRANGHTVVSGSDYLEPRRKGRGVLYGGHSQVPACSISATSYEGAEEELMLTDELSQATLAWLFCMPLTFNLMTSHKEPVAMSKAELRSAF